MSHDLKYTADYRFGGYLRYADIPNKPYGWKTNGILSKISPAFLMQSNNPILTKLMKYIDMWSINLFLSIEKIAKFKNYMIQ